VRLVDGGLGLEAGLSVLVLAPELYAPLRGLAAQWHASADGMAVATRMLDLLDDEPAAPTAGALPASPAVAAVRLERVSVSYAGRGSAVLNDLELELAPGETVALVGPSGSGKTTATALVLGLRRPDAGVVRVGGTDLATCDREQWWRHVGWSPQHPTLFRGSIAENLRLGSPVAADADVRQAARLAAADVFVTALPDGYGTPVGDGGRPLSAGETRRIGLARALLRRAPLLVLDEPTADLDREAAERVMRTIAELRGTCTILLVTHDPALARVADRVTELGAGAPAEPRGAGAVA
jgi:ABC-type transport system involved in cytochrome bd biosynthesis fused ATPase/permease subunit